MKLFGLKDIQFNQIFNEFERWLHNSIGSVTTINKSSIFGQLMTVLAGVTHNIILYIEDALTEQNKYTAQRKKSIYALATQSGYVPSYGRAAGVWLKFEHKANNLRTTDVVIPDRTRLICSKNGLYYCLYLDKPAITIKCSDGLENTYFYAVQGKFESQLFTVSGGSLYNINMSFTGYLDPDYLQVFVNGEKYEQRASLYDMLAQEKAFTYRYNPVSGIDIMFGNGWHGCKLFANDVVEVKYLLHDGEAGNMKCEPDDFFLFCQPLKNTNGEEVEGNQLFTIKFATQDAIAAGSNSEALSQVKQMIGFNSRALVLADSNNYKAFINRFSFCGYNRTWSEPGSMVVKSIIMRNYKLAMNEGKDYFNLTEDDFKLTDSQKTSIKNAITKSNMQLAGTIYDIIDMELCEYAAYIHVKLKDITTDRRIVTQKIKNSVGEFFGNIQSDSYVPKSDIIVKIKEDVPEVDGVNVYFLSRKNEEALQNGKYVQETFTYNPAIGTYDKKTKTVWLFPGENPNLGFDDHGNIVVNEDHQFPVLMGGWAWINDKGDEIVAQPITVMYE